VWREANGVVLLVDGHHRLDICEKHDLPFNVRYLNFKDRDEVLGWIDANQAGRRNVSKEEMTAIIGRIYNQRKRQNGGDRKSVAQIEPVISFTKKQPKSTAEAVGQEFGVSAATVKRCGQKVAAIERGCSDGAANTKPKTVAKAEVKLSKKLCPLCGFNLPVDRVAKLSVNKRTPQTDKERREDYKDTAVKNIQHAMFRVSELWLEISSKQPSRTETVQKYRKIEDNLAELLVELEKIPC
jgi:hypothetical protein